MLYEPPATSDNQITAAAMDLTNLGRVGAMDKGRALFRRDSLTCVGWSNPAWEVDFSDCATFEANVPFLSIDEVDPERSWNRHLALCRLEITQAMERYDFEWAQTFEALSDDDPRYRPNSQPWDRV